MFLLAASCLVTQLWIELWTGGSRPFYRACDILIHVGSLAGLMSLSIRTVNSTTTTRLLIQLVAHAEMNGSSADWQTSMRRELLFTLSLWCVAMTVRMVSTLQSDSAFYLMETVTFGVSSLVFFIVVFSQVYVANGLKAALNSFCRNSYVQPDPDRIIQQWQVLQAILRNASYCLQWSFFVTLSVSLSVVLSTAAVIQAGTAKGFPWSLCAHLCIALSATRSLSAASAVSDSCRVAPALLNTFIAKAEVDYRRQCVMAYMRDSEAGFYMFGMLVTGSLAIKCGYFTTIVVIHFASKAVLDAPW